MTLWTVSGIVMMYVAFPDLEEPENYAGLPAINVANCCNLDFLNSDDALTSVNIKMKDSPVLDWRDVKGDKYSTDLSTGLETSRPGSDTMIETGLAFSQRAYGAATLKDVKRISVDQWTVYGKYNAHRPLVKIRFSDPKGRVLYLSSQDGSVVLETNTKERFWNWFGAVPHWLYYTGLRKHQAIWSNLIVWTSIFAGITTLLGLYLGLFQCVKSHHRFSTYKGLMRWHHITGLLFGLFTLMWVVSGLFSMNPWGLMEGGSTQSETSRLEAAIFSKADIQNLINLLGSDTKLGRPLNAETPSKGTTKRANQNDVIQARLIGGQGEVYGLLTFRDGSKFRINLRAQTQTIPTEAEIKSSMKLIRPLSQIKSVGLITHEDAYYYGHKEDIALPVWRVIVEDRESTRYYFSAESGRLVKKVDRAAKEYRWLHKGLHRLDFLAGLRGRPLWDLVTLILLLGVTSLCATGTWLGWRRINRNLRQIGE